MPQPERELDPTRSPQAWFGAELRLRRKAAGFKTARSLAERVQVSVDVIYKVERGEYRCPRDLAPRLDRALGTDGLFERAWDMAFEADSRASEADNPPAGLVAPPKQALEGLILGGTTTPTPTGSDPVHRRALLVLGGLAALAPTDLAGLLTPTTSLPLPTSISPREVRQLLDIASSLQAWDNLYGGGGVVGQFASDAMRWAIGLLSADCSSTLRPHFLAAVARLGLVAGASKFDVCDHQAARTAFRIAVECAEEGKHWHLRAKGYSLLARQAVWINEADDGLTYAEKGLVRSDRLTATERAMLHTARARAFGRLHNLPETLAAVSAADEAFAQRQRQDDPPWMAYYDEAQHNGDTAHALFDLAISIEGYDPAQAAQRLHRAIQGHGDAFARSRAISSTKLASLTMRRGDPQEAAALGQRALSLSSGLTSRRTAQDLRELGVLAARHPHVSAAADLRERIAATLQS
jgi:transcriptional regulator with XRE-family HTH domain